MMKKNLFIAFEGIDGSGKSTQVKILAEKLTASGHKVYSTFEPTDSTVGAMIRDIFKGVIQEDHRVIAGLFVADRLHHLLNASNGICKKLSDGYTVITDRYYFSSYAYQGTHMDMDWVIKSNAMSAEILRPDVNFFIDVQPETSVQRLRDNRDMIELYETLDNLVTVRDKYYEAFKKLKDEENILIINGDRTQEEISNDIFKEVERMLDNKIAG